MVAGTDIPGGSIGDPQMSVVPRVNDIRELISILESDFGYDTAHNYLFRKFVRNRLVADLGCGHGFSSIYLSTKARRVVGFDIDKAAIKHATRLATKLQISNVEFHMFDGYKTEYPDSFFDIVVSADVIEHIHKPIQHLNEAFRILANGGLLLISTPNGLIANGNLDIIRAHSPYHVMEYTPQQLYRMIQSCGFTLVSAYCQHKITHGKRVRSKIGNRLVTLRNCLGGETLIQATNKLSLMRSIKHWLGHTEGIECYLIDEVPLNEITPSNCDAILFVARK